MPDLPILLIMCAVLLLCLAGLGVVADWLESDAADASRRNR